MLLLKKRKSRGGVYGLHDGEKNLLTVNMRCPHRYDTDVYTTQIDGMRLYRRIWILHNFEVKMLPIKKGYTVLMMIKDKIGKILAAAAEKITPSLFIFVLITETNMFL